jgi:hypothetical protein
MMQVLLRPAAAQGWRMPPPSAGRAGATLAAARRAPDCKWNGFLFTHELAIWDKEEVLLFKAKKSAKRGYPGIIVCAPSRCWRLPVPPVLARDRVCCLSEGTKICPYGAYFALECMLLRLHLQAMMISTQTMQKHQRRISAHATRIPIALLWAQRAGQVLPLRFLTTRRSSLASPVMLLIM